MAGESLGHCRLRGEKGSVLGGLNLAVPMGPEGKDI